MVAPSTPTPAPAPSAAPVPSDPPRRVSAPAAACFPAAPNPEPRILPPPSVPSDLSDLSDPSALSPTFRALLSALANNEPLPKIITRLNLTVDDLHAFLSTPGIPDQLQALRALTHFAEDLQQSAARTEATAYLRTFLTENNTPEEKRRAATALLRGPSRVPRPSGAGGSLAPRAGSAKSDIADWSPSDPTLDDEDDADLDEEADADDTASDDDNASSPQDKPRPEWYRPPPPPSPPLDATPEQVVAHQIDLLRKLETPDAIEATRAIYESISMPVKMFEDCNRAFKAALADSGALELVGTANSPDLTITTSPATIDQAADPPLATIHVTITHPDSRTTAVRFHLFHENYHKLPSNLRWLTAIIVRDDSG